MNNLVLLGIFLIIIGEPIASVGQIYQKKYHNFHLENKEGYKLPWHKSTVFWKYYGIEYVGTLMTSISLFFTPVLLFIPLSNSKLIFNIIFSNKILKEDIYTSDIIALFIIFLGSCISVYFSTFEKEKYNSEIAINNFKSTRFIVANIVYTFLIIFFYFTYKKFDEATKNKIMILHSRIILKKVSLFIKIRFISLCLISGILSSINFLANNLLIISINYAFNCSYISMCLVDPIIYTIVSILLFFLYLVIFQQLIKNYNSILLFPTAHICNVIFSTSYSIIFFKQLLNENKLFFIIGIVISIFGILVKISNHLSISNMKKINSANELA